jgi:hypothetical protein
MHTSFLPPSISFLKRCVKIISIPHYFLPPFSCVPLPSLLLFFIAFPLFAFFSYTICAYLAFCRDLCWLIVCSFLLFSSTLAYTSFRHLRSLLVDCFFCVFPSYVDAVQQRSSRLSQESIVSARFFCLIIVF